MATIAASLLTLGSCISEDFSPCTTDGDRQVRVYFSFATDNPHSKHMDDNATEANRIQLLAFDSKGTFAGEWIDEAAQPADSSYYMEIPLKAGSYSLVAWSGLSDAYAIVPYPLTAGETDIDGCLMKIARDADNSVKIAPNHLFHGNLATAVVSANERTDHSFTVELAQNTNVVNVRTEGFPPSVHSHSLTITDDNGSYYFDGSLAPDSDVHYATLCAKDSQSQLAGSLTVMRLYENRPRPLLTLRDETTKQTVFRADLIALLLKLRDKGQVIDFNTMHTFDILLSFQNDMSITININGWDVGEQDDEEIRG